MPFTLFDIPNCYYIEASFHGKNKDDYGYEFKIWAAGDSPLVLCRKQIPHKAGTKNRVSTADEAIQFCKEFITGESKMSSESTFILYSLDRDQNGLIGTSLGVYESLDKLGEAAKNILSASRPGTVLYVARFYGTIKLDVVIEGKEVPRVI